MPRTQAISIVACLLLCTASAFAQDRKTENVVLIMTDGLRWQEVFRGAEAGLLSKEVGGVGDVAAIRKKFWRETPEGRREALMPFFWTTIASKGQLFGNADKASEARVTNGMKFSYPGYNEVLTGAADPKIISNAKRPNQNVTVLEWLHRREGFKDKVAAFSGWDVMPFIINRNRAAFPVMGGWEPVPEKEPNERQKLLNELIETTTRYNAAELNDSFVFHAVREHVLRHKPRVLFMSFLETDHWGHAGRYDNVLESAHQVDGYIAALWKMLQSMEQYCEKTTFIVTTDHGRGSGPEQWKHHGKDVVGAENIWIAVLGPDTPALGERSNCDAVTQSQVAATVARLLGEDYHAALPTSGVPIADVLPKAK